MEATAKLITAVGALFGAIAWPLVFVAMLVTFRKELRSFGTRLPGFLDRLRRMKVAGIEAELDVLAANAPSNGEVTTEQVRTSAQLAIESREVGKEHLISELDKLCLQYDTIRRTMRSGQVRTQEMTRILVKMRALGPATSSRIDVYKSSGSAGSRLAAVAMMQMEPVYADLNWLLERFCVETPFIFYHAALALTNAANSEMGCDPAEVITTARAALGVVQSFEGVPDEQTLGVLRALAQS